MNRLDRRVFYASVRALWFLCQKLTAGDPFLPTNHSYYRPAMTAHASRDGDWIHIGIDIDLDDLEGGCK